MKRLITILCFVLSFAMCANAQESGIDLLTIGPGAKALSLNGAVTAERLGASDLYTNPANLAIEESSELNADYTLWIGDINHAHAAINFKKNNRGLAFGFISSQVKDIPLRGNQAGPAQGSFAVSFLSLGGAYAHKIGPLAIGGTAQYLREEYYVYNASGYAFNLGLASEIIKNRIRVGASLLNAGKMDELRSESTPLPTSVKAGYSAKLFTFVPPKNTDLPISLLLKNNMVFPLQTSRKTTQNYTKEIPYLNIALEVIISDIISVRSGYKTENTVRHWSAGVGIDVSSIEINYALIPFETGFGTAHSIGLTYRF